MQAPGFFQKKATVRGNRCVRPEDMRQRGDIGTLRMAALHWLLELPRIAEKYDIVRGLRDGEDIGKRHLRRFIDKQRIDGLKRVGTRPQPSGSGSHLTARADRPEKFSIVGRELQSRQIGLLFWDF